MPIANSEIFIQQLSLSCQTVSSFRILLLLLLLLLLLFHNITTYKSAERAQDQEKTACQGASVKQ